MIPNEHSQPRRVQTLRGRGGAVVPFNRLESQAWDLLAALAWGRHPHPLARLRDVLQDLTGRRILLAPSGQAAIAQILSSLPQREVVMAAYLCEQVKRAAEIAGKRVIYVDLARNSVNATSSEFAEAAKPGRILLAVHVWGVPTDIEAICQLAKDRDCVVIEDAVPAFGGRWNGRPLGTFGDFGVFSFHYSKRLSALRGGAIVVNNDRIVDPVKLEASRVVQSRRAMPIRDLLVALAQNLATTPWIYRNFTRPLLPLRGSVPLLWRKPRQKRAPVHADRQAAAPTTDHFTRDYAREIHPCQAGLELGVPGRFGETRERIAHLAAFYDETFDQFIRDYTREVHPYQAELALRVLRRFDETRERIARLATIYQEAFRDTPITTFLPPGCDNAGLVRFPVAFPGKDRAEILRLAQKRGLYLKVLWGPLPDESELARFPNAVRVARSLVLLPLYSTLPPESAERLAQNLIEIERNAPEVEPAKRLASGVPAARSQHAEVSRQERNLQASAFSNQQEHPSAVTEN